MHNSRFADGGQRASGAYKQRNCLISRHPNPPETTYPTAFPAIGGYTGTVGGVKFANSVANNAGTDPRAARGRCSPRRLLRSQREEGTIFLFQILTRSAVTLSASRAGEYRPRGGGGGGLFTFHKHPRFRPSGRKCLGWWHPRLRTWV